MSLVDKQRLLIAIGLVAVVGMLWVPRIPQDPAYHQFADQRAWLAIPNAFNVLSNGLFAWVAIEGLYRLLRQKSLRILPALAPAYGCFFLSLLLVALGSGYYHWAPDNRALVLDRTPITLAFMSFFSVLLAERVSPPLARRLFPLLLAAGLASVAYWYFSEQAGRGDLRAYLLVQFLPLLMTPPILLLFDSPFDRGRDIGWLVAWFVIAKLCEHYDREIYAALSAISGHSLKHVFAGVACLVYLRHLKLRQPRPA